MVEEEFDLVDGQSSSGGNRSISPRLFFDANRPNRFLHEGDIYGDWPLLTESKTPYTIRSIGYSCLCTVGHDALAAAFEEYPHCRRMVRRKANLLRQRHEQRWNWRNGQYFASPKSFDSEEFFFQRRSPGQRSTMVEIFAEGDEEYGEDEFGKTSTNILEHCSVERRLQKVQRAIQSIENEVEVAEKNFVNLSMNLKKWLSKLEQEYFKQRPRLKTRLQRWKWAMTTNKMKIMTKDKRGMDVKIWLMDKEGEE